MLSENRSVYRDKVIQEHSRNPRHYGMIANASACAERASPTCGDVMSVYLMIDEKCIIQQIHFDGSLCAIATASASIMTDAISGLSVSDTQQRIISFKNFLEGGKDSPAVFNPEELEVLNKASQIVGRKTCTTLPWETLQAALDDVKAATASP